MLNIQGTNKRPSTSSRSSSCSDWSGTPRGGNAFSKTFGNDSVRIAISLHPNAKLERMFPNDDAPNIIIHCGNKVYALNTAHLRLDSTFFANINVSELHIDPTRFQGDHGELIVERILRCLYGGRSFLDPSDVYPAYQLCKEWGIEKLIELIQTEVIHSFNSFNFFMILQLAVQFNEENLLAQCKSKLESTAFSEIRSSSQRDHKRSNSFTFSQSGLYPTTLYDIDAEALRFILSVNRQSQSLPSLELFSILKTFFATNSTQFLAFCREFVPAERLTSSEYGYIQKSLTPEELFKFSYQVDNGGMGKSVTGTGSVNDSRIYQLESENMYYQLKMREMQAKNDELQSEMRRMKESIEQRSRSFQQSETELNSKLNFLEKSIRQFETIEQQTKTEYGKTISKLKVRMREYEVEIQEKKESVENLNQILKNFTFQATEAKNNNAVPSGHQDFKKQASTSPGFFQRGNNDFTDARIPSTARITDQSMMTVVSYNYGNEGAEMLQSEAIPIYSVIMTNQNQATPTNKQQQSILTSGRQLVQSQKSLPEIQDIITKKRHISIIQQSDESWDEKSDTDIAAIMGNRQMMQFEEEETKTNEIVTNSQINESFVSFDQTSNVLEDASEDYQAMFTNFFRLSLFKPMKLQLLYRSSRDGFSRFALNSKVQSIGETLILIKSWEPSQIFGGYLSVPWPDQTQDSFVRDEKAFIFSITHNLKMNAKNPEYALYVGNDFLFSLGSNDICIVEGGHEDTKNTSNYPDDYEKLDEYPNNMKPSCLFAGSSKFQVDELEVYSIDQNLDMDF